MKLFFAVSFFFFSSSSCSSSSSPPPLHPPPSVCVCVCVRACVRACVCVYGGTEETKSKRDRQIKVSRFQGFIELLAPGG